MNSAAKVALGGLSGTIVGALVGALGGVAGAIVGLLVGGAIGAGATGAGITMAATRPGASSPTRRRADRIDPFTVSEPWRRQTQRALEARRQFHDAVARVSPGPIHDRLASIGASVDAAIEEVWATARAGHELASARSRIDAGRARRELAAARAEPADTESADTDPAASYEAVVASAQRIVDTIDDADRRLKVLNARLDETVAHGIELSVGAYRPDEFAELESTMTTISDELAGLRAALAEVSGSPQAQGG